MLDLKRIRDDLANIREAAVHRNASIDLDGLLALDGERKGVLGEVEALKHERNVTSDKIATLKREKKDAADEIGRMKEVSARIKGLDPRLAELDEKISALLLTIPNIPHESVPVGETEADNAFVREWGEKPAFDFEPKDHVALGEDLGILDFERGAKIAGARFTLYRGLGAAMERALISFMLDIHTQEHGYLEVLPPFMANTKSFIGTGQLPKFEEDLFKVEERDLYLVPTAEVPVTNIHQDEILEAEELPVRYAAFTPCFRKEAGAHGKDTRGLIRQHQFNKVELVKIVRPESSYDELELLLTHAEAILQRLGLHYRVVTLCTADLSFSAAKCYDLEVWLPGQGAYREISSCSNFEDFQARRAAIRYRPEKGAKTKFVHTLNGSGLAIGRTVVAILEACQQADGSVVIPEALRPYMNGVESIQKA